MLKFLRLSATATETCELKAIETATADSSARGRDEEVLIGDPFFYSIATCDSGFLLEKRDAKQNPHAVAKDSSRASTGGWPRRAANGVMSE